MPVNLTGLYLALIRIKSPRGSIADSWCIHMGIKHDDRVTIADAPNDVADSVGLHRIEAELHHFCFY